MSEPEITIEYRVKNGRLKRAILAKYPTYRAFCNATGVDYGPLNSLLGMRESPLLKSGEWRAIATDIADALSLMPEDLWPAEMAIALSRTGGEVHLSLDAAKQIAADNRINQTLLDDLQSYLPERERALIEHTLNGGNVAQWADSVGLSRGRAGQIYDRAIRRMKRVVEVKRLDVTDAYTDEPA